MSVGSPYSWLLLAGIFVTIGVWSRLVKGDRRLLAIYVAALLGAFLGAKLLYLLVEGWFDWPLPDRWQRLATGKTILGGLLGGYIGVEVAKRFVGYRDATGDWFALIAPLGIAMGRIGCWAHGCCLGRLCAPGSFATIDTESNPRWPAVPVEFGFNIMALLVFCTLRATRKLKGQHFHIYLIAYGLFRAAHEFQRETPRLVGMVTGYQLAALAVTLFGVVGFLRRHTRLMSLPVDSERMDCSQNQEGISSAQ